MLTNEWNEIKSFQIKRRWVVNMLEDKIRIQPNITHEEVIEYFKHLFFVLVEDSKTLFGSL